MTDDPHSHAGTPFSRIGSGLMMDPSSQSLKVVQEMAEAIIVAQVQHNLDIVHTKAKSQLVHNRGK